MSRLQGLALLVFTAFVFNPHLSSAQGEAARYVIVPSGAEVIDAKRDYYSISLVRGWYSARHAFLQTLLSTDTKSSVLLQSSVTLGGQTVERALTFSNTSVKKNVEKPWGINPTIYPRLPGNTDPTLAVQVAIYQSSTTQQILQALDDSKGEALIGTLATAPFTGYVRAVSGVFTSLFGLNRERYPFIWQGNIRVGAAVSGGNLREHYLVLIAPRRGDDRTFATLDGSQLQYVNDQLQLNGQVVKDWTYAVFHIRKEQPYDIPQMVNDDNSAWAGLASSFFTSLPVSDLGNKDELRTTARTVIAQLRNMQDLLLRDSRFSSFTRTEALITFARRSRDQINGRCTSLGLPEADCPLSEIDNFIAAQEKVFPTLRTELQHAVDRNITALRARH